jgi:hypothetical protein
MSSHQSIAERAYHLWSARGRPHGSEKEDWLEAERQLSSAKQAGGDGEGRDAALDASLKETFPASDPAASRLPDVPPSNAAEKWKAAGKKPRKDARSSSKANASSAARTAAASDEVSNPPVDETDDGPATAPGNNGEG